MELISLQGKTCALFHSNTSNYTSTHTHHSRFDANRNFFEKRVAEYQKANIMSRVNSSTSADSILTNSFSLEADF